MKNDVLIVGAGPAGSVAATVLARAGVRVRLLDRATFPREKLCGDTINPGTLALLRRLGMAAFVETKGLPVGGMLVTGGPGVAVRSRYPAGLQGRAVTRAELDWALVQAAMEAGATFEPGVTARRAVVHESRGSRRIEGVEVGNGPRPSTLRALVTIAADGRRSTLAFGLALARHPRRPRRWAIGAYFDGVGENPVNPGNPVNPIFGEMHIRRDCYIGVAPIPGGATNVCLVKPSGPADADLADPTAALRRELARDPLLASRFSHARLLRPPSVLGPLAVEASLQSLDGLLTAGDASGFVDPMTGDGLRFAVRGGEFAARAALEALEHGWPGVHARLHDARRREFGGKWRFNRALRAIVSSDAIVRSAALAARLAPRFIDALVAHAGDCDICSFAESPH